MKKRIIIVLETESEDCDFMTDEFVRDDLETEINCTVNLYNIVSFETEELT